MENREQWGTRIGFILAAVGSAIGLGNIWRFPYIAYENGGGAFLIPYFFAMLTAGIPLLILEFGTGHRHHGAAPLTFFSISRKWEWLGWWQVLVAFVIATYYVAVIGWAISYFFFAFSQGWGDNTGDFFFKTFLGLADSPLHPSKIQWGIFAAVSAAWIICWGALVGGIKHGIEKANKVFMPLLFFMVLIIMGRALFLPGAVDGVDWLFKPDFSKLMDVKVWVAAYGQIFYSLSIGFAIMITYSSYLPKDSDINNNAFMTAFINCGFSMIAGIMIFSILGYMAARQGVGIEKVVAAGPGLAFVTIPTAINFMPAPALFGGLFFLSITVAGLSSQISICEACVSSVIEKLNSGRTATVTVFCLIGFGVSVIYTTDAGLLILDIVDHFINNLGVLMTGLVEIIFLSWLCSIETTRAYVNKISDFRVGSWWTFCLKFITPVVLSYMAFQNFLGDLKASYGGYSDAAVMTFGWFICGAIVVLSVLIQVGKPFGKSEKNN